MHTRFFLQGLRSADGDWIELANGCMCCSIKSDFVKALEALLEKPSKPEYILIETTGARTLIFC